MVDIRLMVAGDREELRTLELSLFREYLERSQAARWEDLSPETIDMLGASNESAYDFYSGAGLSFVALEEDRIVGFLFAQMMEHVHSVPRVVWIENVGVHPDHRREGTAYLLVRKAVHEGRARGADMVYSTIMLDNLESILLHKKLGFMVEERRIALLDLDSSDL